MSTKNSSIVLLALLSLFSSPSKAEIWGGLVDSNGNNISSERKWDYACFPLESVTLKNEGSEIEVMYLSLLATEGRQFLRIWSNNANLPVSPSGKLTSVRYQEFLKAVLDANRTGAKLCVSFKKNTGEIDSILVETNRESRP